MVTKERKKQYDKKYEESHKDARKAAHGQFTTSLPRQLYDEINEYLAKKKISKVDFIANAFAKLKESNGEVVDFEKYAEKRLVRTIVVKKNGKTAKGIKEIKIDKGENVNDLKNNELALELAKVNGTIDVPVNAIGRPRKQDNGVPAKKVGRPRKKYEYKKKEETPAPVVETPKTEEPRRYVRQELSIELL